MREFFALQTFFVMEFVVFIGVILKKTDKKDFI
jgi:hypothetical protein